MVIQVKGIITPMVTPIKNGKIEKEYVIRLIEFLKKIDVAGLFPMGSTGLFPFFSTEVHLLMLDYTINNAPAGMKVFAGASRNNLEETLTVAKKAKDFGADAVVIVTPYYIKLSQESIKRYYENIASKLNCDILVYNIPPNTCNSIQPETLSDLMREHSNIIGIKDSSGDMKLFQGFVNELPKEALIYQGLDELLLPSMSLGASGGVCGSSNFSDLIVRLYKTGSKELNKKVVNLKKLLSKSEFPKAYYYLFNRIVLGLERPKDYMPFPIEDLKQQEEMLIYKEFTNLQNE